MKATGIVRRVDDLGRVVIPKETRRMMGIREGDPMEIFVDDGAIVLKPYFATDESIDLISLLKEKTSSYAYPENKEELLQKLDEIEVILKRRSANDQLQS